MYTYTALPEGSIRIIELQPAKARKEPLRIILKEVPLPDEARGEAVPKYEALSYVWGAKYGDREIQCDGKTLRVTPNCETALRYLRHSKRSRTLWIDAISIDQTNDEEKSIQVQRMKDIYQQAVRVVIWLGESNAFTASAFRYFGSLINRKLPSRAHIAWYQLSAGTQKYAQRIRGTKGNQTTSSSVEYLREIFDNPYFRRIWTVQETALAKDAVVLCGDIETSWKQLLDGVTEFIGAEPAYMETVNGVRKFVQTDDKAQYFEDHRRSSQLRSLSSLTAEQYELNTGEAGSPQLHQLRFLLRTAHSHEASEPKDRIFGLYQLFLDLDISLPTPSYHETQTVESVFTAATKAIIRATKSLNILDNIVVHERDPSLPSWAHEFRSKLEYHYDILWKASMETQVDVGDLDANGASHLRLKGIVIGEISQRGDVLPSGKPGSTPVPDDDENFPNPDWMSIIAACRSWLMMLDQQDWVTHEPTNETPLEALFQLLLCQVNEIEEESDIRGGFEFWHTTVRELAVNPLPSDQLQILVDFQATLPKTPSPRWTNDLDAMLFLKKNDAENVSLAVFIYMVWQHARERCLFCATSGHLGLGHRDTRLGDSIILFAGATMPMIIRPSGSSFQLVGPAIVHGAMEGDLWQSRRKDNGAVLESFDLI